MSTTTKTTVEAVRYARSIHPDGDFETIRLVAELYDSGFLAWQYSIIQDWDGLKLVWANDRS